MLRVAAMSDAMQVRFATLESIGHAIASPQPLEGLLEMVTDLILQAVPSEAATMFLMDPSGDRLRFAVTRGPNAEQLRSMSIPAGQGIAGWVIENNHYALVPNVDKDRRFCRSVDQTTGFSTKSLLCVPLHTRHGVIGAVELINPTQAEFTDAEATFVTSIANQAAQLIENVRLFQDRERHGATLEALQQAARWLNSTLHIKDVLERIVTAADEVIKAEAGSILLVGDDGKLDFTVALGPAGPDLMARKDEIRDQLEAGIVGWVAKTGKAELIADTTEDARFVEGPGPAIHDETGFQTKSILCVPMRARNETVGVVELINRADGKPFDSNDLATLSVFADDAAAALTNARLFESLERSYFDTINSLAIALDLRDNETGGHSQRVALLAKEVALRLALTEEEVDDVHKGSLLHDVGKIGVPDEVLLKPGKLDDEWKIMRRHVLIGYRLLAGIEFLKKASLIPLFHHERYDGKGYLAGLKGEAIPLGARIFAIIDAYDAMTSDRPYRKALGDEEARKRIHEELGGQFDPRVARIFLSIPPSRTQEIRETLDIEHVTSHRFNVVGGEEDKDTEEAREAHARLKDEGVL